MIDTMIDNADLKVLIVSTEVSPYSKSGGLGDVIGSLPVWLRQLGADVRVVMPKYRAIREEHLTGFEYVDSFVVSLSWRKQSASIFESTAGVPTYLIENDYYFGRDGYYGYGDDYERFAFFSKASVEFLTYVDFQPDVIHFNDWQTGLGPVYLRDIFGKYTFYSGIKSLFTIHNLQYQGVYGRDILWNVGLNDSYYTNGSMEFYGNISLMKAGLSYADAISTVSETYADEIKTPQYGFSMDGILRAREDCLHGIVNGIDYAKNDPETDPLIHENFDKKNIGKKKNNKTALQQELSLPERDVPMISIISRLVDQKGLDLIAVAMDELVGKDIQLVVLGTGNGRYEDLFKTYAWRAPDKVSANITFNEGLAQRIYASSDMLLMPSMFEPCGLGQLVAMRYGTVPIVRRTGGLADTVTHFSTENKNGTGFVFNDYWADAMMWAVNTALGIYPNVRDWRKIGRNGMSEDFSWKRSAERYIELYREIKHK